MRWFRKSASSLRAANSATLEKRINENALAGLLKGFVGAFFLSCDRAGRTSAEFGAAAAEGTTFLRRVLGRDGGGRCFGGAVLRFLRVVGADFRKALFFSSCVAKLLQTVARLVTMKRKGAAFGVERCAFRPILSLF